MFSLSISTPRSVFPQLPSIPFSSSHCCIVLPLLTDFKAKPSRKIKIPHKQLKAQASERFALRVEISFNSFRIFRLMEVNEETANVAMYKS